MPIYAYRCASCGHAKDVLQKLSDAPLSVCPACGAATFAKQVTAAGFQLKGSGWYATDFKGGNSTKKPEGDGKTDSASADASKNDAGKTEAGKTDSGKTDSGKSDSSKSDSSKTDSAKSGESGTPAKSGDAGSSSSTSTTPSA
ncbi:MAG TPA: zinc ribbon domain-containing protein [Burkholderiaceae bacterium]|nr:zinc ribbon domain-containing protein [Burkholderiaceae bacterium]